MNIDNLTIGQLKELAPFFNINNSSIHDRNVGKYVICRSRNEGVNAGKVLQADDTGVVLEDARRLYYHMPLDKKISWYEGVAKSGLGEGSKTGCAVEKIIVEDYSLTVCTPEAEKSIREAKEHEQN